MSNHPRWQKNRTKEQRRLLAENCTKLLEPLSKLLSAKLSGQTLLTLPELECCQTCLCGVLSLFMNPSSSYKKKVIERLKILPPMRLGIEELDLLTRKFIPDTPEEAWRKAL